METIEILCKLSPQNASIDSRYNFQNFSNVSGIGSNYVYSILPDSKGRVWFATDGKGFTMYENGKFSNFNDRFQSSVVSVTPNAQYTLSAFIKTGTWPSGSVSIFALEFDSSGAFVRQLESTLTSVSAGAPNVWQEAATLLQLDGSTRYISFGAARVDDQWGSGPVWLDDIAILPGVQVRVQNTAKAAFDGSQTRVDSLGNWEVLENGAWKPWFPLCVAANADRSSFAPLAAGGFNCDIWGGVNAYGVQKAKSAGMRSFFNLSQYYQPTGWAYRNWGDLAARIAEINASPAADALAGYWMDNEAPFGTFSDYETMARTIQNNDRLNGQRRRPIVQLQKPSWARSFTNNGVAFSDALAAYMPANDGSLRIGAMLDGQNQPSTMCQLSGGNPAMRSVIYNCLAQGGRSISYWMDGNPGQTDHGFAAGPVDQNPWWPELAAVSREITALLPVIRSAPATNWSISSSTLNDMNPVSWTTRNTGGIAHMILANLSGSAQQVTFQVQSSPYAVGEVRDYFTNQLLAVAQNGSFTLNLSAATVSTGTLAVKLLPR